MAAPTGVDRFLSLCCDEVERRAALASKNRDVLVEGAGEFRRALDGASPTEHQPATVPVARHLSNIVALSSTTVAISEAAQAVAPELGWLASPQLDDGGVSVGVSRLNHLRDLGAVTCGLMLLAPEGEYPLHQHPPQEIYLPIAGHGRWRHGGAGGYETLEPDQLVYNPPNALHGTVAASDPLLALYLLWD